MRRTLALLLATVAACGSDGSSAPDGGTTGDGGTVPDGGTAIDAPGSAACGQAGAPTGTAMGTITVGGTERTYVRVVPASYDPNRTYPLIFAWHGRTGSAQTARQYFGIEAAAGDGAIFVYPQGLPVSNNPSDTGWELTANGRDVALFDALRAEIASQYCVGRIYSMGHSFGGYMSNALACYRGGTAPEAVRAIASIAGGGPFGGCSGDPVSAVIIHGTGDMVVPFAQGEGSRDTWRTAAGCATTSTAATPSPCVGYDGCSAGLAVRWCEHSMTANGGHGWPGFAAAAAWQLFQDAP